MPRASLRVPASIQNYPDAQFVHRTDYIGPADIAGCPVCRKTILNTTTKSLVVDQVLGGPSDRA